MKNINLVEQYVQMTLQNEHTGHDYYHSIRVMNNAIALSENETVDIEQIKVCCLVHDLIDYKVTKDIVKAKKDLEGVLKSAGYLQDDIKQIFEVIEHISFSKGMVPDTLEGKIVQDADRLEALGAIGIARTFAYGGKNNRLIYDPKQKGNDDSISHFYDKLLTLEEKMNTENGKKIAKERTDYMKDFLSRFYQEWNGTTK
ncbi:MAG: HD domain-containing protein [Bacilli bacterium]|nr:HD domain-containing protein [Bacilli bacterium]